DRISSTVTPVILEISSATRLSSSFSAPICANVAMGNTLKLSKANVSIDSKNTITRTKAVTLSDFFIAPPRSLFNEIDFRCAGRFCPKDDIGYFSGPARSGYYTPVHSVLDPPGDMLHND